MKRLLLTWGLGVALLLIQSVLLGFLPFPWCPDLVLLLTMALGLHWVDRVSGLALVAALGFCADFLSGALLGQYVLVYLVSFGGTALLSRRLNLRGALPLALCAGWVTVLAAAVAGGASMLLGGASLPPGAWFAALLLHALVNAALAPGICTGIAVWLSWLSSEGGVHRPVQIESSTGPT